MRLAAELENVATSYNNSISDRKLFAATNTIYEGITLSNLEGLGFKVLNNETNTLVGFTFLKSPGAADPAATVINSEADFLNLVNVMNGGDAAATTALAGNYVLGCDVNLSDNGTFSDAVIEGQFTGTFDGQGYTISGLNISSSQYEVGLFSSTSSSAMIKNLGVTGVNIASSGADVGAIVGRNYGAIENVFATGTVTGTSTASDRIGGALGHNYGNVSDSYASVNVSGDYRVGGFVGYNDGTSADIYRSYSTGDVSGRESVGGFAGASFNNGSITDCFAVGDVSGTTDVGGFIGKMGWVAISNSYATGDVSGATNVGGFAGENWGDSASTVDNKCFWNTDSSTVGLGNNLNVSGLYFEAQGLTSSEIETGDYTANGGWSSSTWDLSGATPVFVGGVFDDSDLEKYLRDGTYSLLKDADSYTQTPLSIGGVDYEEVDWRVESSIHDDLYKGNDVDAENNYEASIEKINAQDKKLQLEQSQIEVEHRAITTEKDAVKSLLNKNIESSFKTFS